MKIEVYYVEDDENIALAVFVYADQSGADLSYIDDE